MGYSQSWHRAGSARRIGAIFALALAAVASSSACCTTPSVILLECPDPPEEAFEVPLPPVWADWYFNDYDPYCEAIYEAANAD